MAAGRDRRVEGVKGDEEAPTTASRRPAGDCQEGTHTGAKGRPGAARAQRPWAPAQVLILAAAEGVAHCGHDDRVGLVALAGINRQHLRVHSWCRVGAAEAPLPPNRPSIPPATLPAARPPSDLRGRALDRRTWQSQAPLRAGSLATSRSSRSRCLL